VSISHFGGCAILKLNESAPHSNPNMLVHQKAAVIHTCDN